GPGDSLDYGKEVSVMKVFVAGGSGTIGVPLVRALVAAGHEVTALTRSVDKQDELRALGASAAVADALDREALIAAVEAAHAAAVRSMESQVLDATRRGSIEGVILRYGMFYGLETPSTRAMINMVRKRRLPVVRNDTGQLPVIHIDDAVSATVRALELAPAGA